MILLEGVHISHNVSLLAQFENVIIKSYSLMTLPLIFCQKFKFGKKGVTKTITST